MPRFALAAVLAGCLGPLGSSPSSHSSSLPASAPATFAPSIAETAAAAADAAAIDQLLSQMAAAVAAGDKVTYMAFVDRSDPVFALEHGRWADDWAGRNPVSRYALSVADLEVDRPMANGALTVDWLMPGGVPRSATFIARFTRGTGGWLYAGEAWAATDAPHFRILAAPGLERDVPQLVDELPAVYDDVTTELEYEPGVSMQIKLYRDAPALVANTLLSLPDIRGWNEPGEALKLRIEPGEAAAATIAHEFTHFLEFDRAGTNRTLVPWWLEEGIATYVAVAFAGSVTDDERLALVAGWSAAGELADWTDMAVFEDTPQDMWQFVYPQGFAFVVYVTETYGRAARNAWLASMATELPIDRATSAAFGHTFDELDTGFREWLAAR